MSKPRQTTPQRRWRQRSLLTVLGLVFSVSAVMRLGSLDVAQAQGPAINASARGVDRPVETAALPGSTPEGLIRPVQAAMEEVTTLRDTLDARAAALADREAAVDAAQRLVEDRLAELEAAEARLRDLISLSDEAAETDLARLTRVYETMNPDEAAPLFEQMDPSFAAGFLARMAPEASAAILTEMPPEAAYAISIVIATRNVQAPVSRAPPANAPTPPATQ